MHIGSIVSGHAHSQVREAVMQRVQSSAQRVEASDKPTKGERLVARMDADNDNKLSISELRDTKMGRRMSVDRFAKLDANSDGMLEAKEFDAARQARLEAAEARRESEARQERAARAAREAPRENMQSSAATESAVRANMAEYLMEKVDDGSIDVAERVLEGLDADKSGGLNSEEIAGTRLAELVGDGFYKLDEDKNGALDKKELAGFIAESLMEKAGTKPGSDAVSGIVGSVETEEVAEAEEAVVEAVEEAAAEDEAAEASTFAAASGSGVSEYASRVQKAFENALEMLKDSGSEQSFNAVSALYKDVQNIFETT